MENIRRAERSEYAERAETLSSFVKFKEKRPFARSMTSSEHFSLQFHTSPFQLLHILRSRINKGSGSFVCFSGGDGAGGSW